MNSSAMDNADNSGMPRWIRVADVSELQQLAYQRILDAADRAIEQRGEFHIVLSGGKTPRAIYQMLSLANADWAHWHIYFGDERCLPAADVNRNSKMASDSWLDAVAIPENQIHVILAELGAGLASVLYAKELHSLADFDLVLLGLGEDGHTASLFPGHDLGVTPMAADVLAVLDAPKLPAQRVTMSGRRLSRTREVLFMVSGESKRDAVSQWQAGAQLPVRAIRPKAGVDVLIEAQLLMPRLTCA